MEALKRIGFYGVSGVGKTTILKEVRNVTSNVIWLEGSKLVINAAGVELSEFKKFSNAEKYFFREKAIESALEIQSTANKHVIIDGHLVFPKSETEFENVMTSQDASFYTDYIYLKLSPELILQRQENDTMRKRSYSSNTIANWIKFELLELEQFCNSARLPLHIIESADTKDAVEFICNIIEA
jgi:adenylate kinase